MLMVECLVTPWMVSLSLSLVSALCNCSEREGSQCFVHVYTNIQVFKYVCSQHLHHIWQTVTDLQFVFKLWGAPNPITYHILHNIALKTGHKYIIFFKKKKKGLNSCSFWANVTSVYFLQHDSTCGIESKWITVCVDGNKITSSMACF